MNCGKLLLLLISFLVYFTCSAQKKTSVSPLQALLASKDFFSINWQGKAIAIADTPFNTFPQNLLKTKDGLYLFVNGSGRLYQLADNGTGIQPQRNDSTIFFGYNFNSFSFVYHDTMYSLGGYGMWRINGQLRAYIPQAHSWDIVPLNEEVPVLMQDNDNNMLWYDKKSGSLYIAYSLQRNQAVKHNSLNEATFDYTVRSLNMQTKEWKDEGELSSVFRGKVDLIRNIAFTPWGQLVTFGDKLLLIDYQHNQLLHFTDEKENKIRPLLFQYPTDSLYYCIDSTLYFGNIRENRLGSLALHKNDFIVSDASVYTNSSASKTVIAASIFSLLLVAGWILWKKKSNQRKLVYNPPLKVNITE